MSKVIVACGGTGGHVFPGLAVAKELQKRDWEVELWLCGREIESSAIHDWEGSTFLTGMRQLSLTTTPQLLKACYRAFKRVKSWAPDVILGMGCYSSLPPVLSASWHRIPVVLHEANAVPGRAVELLSRSTHATAISFHETRQWLPGRNVVFTGLPVRNTMLTAMALSQVPAQAFTVLITGGSQGARAVNELASKAMALLQRAGATNLFVIHQSGAADVETLRTFYQEAGVNAMVSAFIPEMGAAYASADLVICRAGASTCFELCLLGKPALLIPLPSAKRDHQHLNAQMLVKGGGADEALQDLLTPRALMRYVRHKMQNPAHLEQMSQALKALAQPHAAAAVADVVESVV